MGHILVPAAPHALNICAAGALCKNLIMSHEMWQQRE
jgi:hypothetical protein